MTSREQLCTERDPIQKTPNRHNSNMTSICSRNKIQFKKSHKYGAKKKHPPNCNSKKNAYGLATHAIHTHCTKLKHTKKQSIIKFTRLFPDRITNNKKANDMIAFAMPQQLIWSSKPEDLLAMSSHGLGHPRYRFDRILESFS